MPTKQDYKNMLKKVIESIDKDLYIAKTVCEAEKMIKNDKTNYEWVIEWSEGTERFRSEEELLKFVKNSFDEDPNFPNQVEGVYKKEVDDNGNDITNEIELGLSWSVTLDEI